DVLARCLQEKPDGRYPTAALLAEDLRRHLTNRPLVGVKNRSMAERWSKWRRRKPYSLAMSLIYLIALLALGGLAVAFAMQRFGRLHEAAEPLNLGRRQILQRHEAEAIETLDRGIRQSEIVFYRDGPIWDELHRQKVKALRGRALTELHEKMEHSRYADAD